MRVSARCYRATPAGLNDRFITPTLVYLSTRYLGREAYTIGVSLAWWDYAVSVLLEVR